MAKESLDRVEGFEESPLKLWCDNKLTINIANNHVQHDKTKHVEIRSFLHKREIR
jgi:hypothetical protein